MPKVTTYNITGAQTGEIELNDSVFGVEVNEAVMRQAVLRQLANERLGTHSTKTRGLVRGGGKKPWKQKGTGRARVGSTRSPLWVGGGTIWGPHPRSYEQKMPRKARRLAVKSAFSLSDEGKDKIRAKFDELTLEEVEAQAALAQHREFKEAHGGQKESGEGIQFSLESEETELDALDEEDSLALFLEKVSKKNKRSRF